MKKKTAAYKEIRQFVQRNEGRIYRDRQERKCHLLLSTTKHYSSLGFTDSKAVTENETS
jgi:hypothetical protein